MIIAYGVFYTSRPVHFGPTALVWAVLWAACAGLLAAWAAPAQGETPAAYLSATPARLLLKSGDQLSISYAESAPENKLPYEAGDRIRITLQEDARVTFEGEVPASGRITLPFLGEFAVGGKTSDACIAGLKKSLEDRLYQHATIVLETLARPHTQRSNASLTVPETGVIVLPDVGSLTVTGTTCADVSASLTALLKQQGYCQPAVETRLLSHSAGSVVIYGAVVEPGEFALPPTGKLTILQLIAKSGGLTSWARPESAYIQRTDADTGEHTRVPVRLSEALAAPQSEADITLQADDMIFIPSASNAKTEMLGSKPSEVIVVGEVGSPGIITFAPGEQRTLLRALLKAGGFGRFAKKDKVRLIRMNDKNQRTVTTIDASVILEEGFLNKDVELNPGDMIIVGEKLFSW